MCDLTPMTPYIAELRAAQSANPSPAPASPSRDALPIPSPGLAGAGDPLAEKVA
jgi:hypothetical protein